MVQYLELLLILSISVWSAQATSKKVNWRVRRLNRNNSWIIVGGEEASIERFPYQVGVVLESVFHKNVREFCGGSIISVEHVLTAGHCLHDYSDEDFPPILVSPDRISVIAGVSNLDDSQVSQGVKEYKVHPMYDTCGDEYTLCNDIAILKTEKFRISKTISPVRIAPTSAFKKLQQMEKKRANCDVAGWGALTEEETYPTHLYAVTLQLVTLEYCKKMNSVHGFHIGREYHTCTLSDGKDACYGDSGGGLLCGRGKDRMIYGVVSFGYGCAALRSPNVYARIDTYYQFIMEYLSQGRKSERSSASIMQSVLYKAQVVLILMYAFYHIKYSKINH